MPSTVIRYCHYDTKKSTLRVVFVSGMVYEYKKVPLKIYDAMKHAPSKGEYLNLHIKGNYEFDKIE